MRFSHLAATRAAFLFLGVLFRLNAAFADAPEVLREVEVHAVQEPITHEKPSAFVSILRPKTYETQIKTLPELLSEQPGVNVQQFGGLGQFSTVTLRGSTAEQVTVLLDGVRLNTAQGGAVDFSTIPLQSIDHVEIIRGGASSQFGSDAMGGVIHIVTKKAKNTQNIELALGAGSFDTFKTTAGYSKRFKKFSFLVDHTHLQSAGDFRFLSTPTTVGGNSIGGNEEFVRHNNQFFSENGLVRLEGDPASKIHLSLTSDWFGSKRHVPPTEDEALLLTPDNPLEARENLLKNISTLTVDLKSVGAKGLNFHIQPYYHYDFSHFQDESPALGGAIDVKYFNHEIGGKVGSDYLLKTGPVLQNFKLSYDFRRDLFHDKNLLTGGPASGSHDRTTHALYFSDEISLLNDQLSFFPSVRFENTNDFGSHTALNLGVKGQPLSWLALKSNIGNSFRYPNFNELFFPNQGFLRGNPNLIPEKSINFDVGPTFIHRYGRHEISYFRNWVDNSILFLPISAFTIAPINTQRMNVQGLEIDNFLTPWKHLEWAANYTLLLANLEGSGKQLPGRPRHKANAKITLKNDWGALYSRLQYIDRLPLDFPNTSFIQQRFQLDAGASLKFFKRYELSLEVKNITNAQMLDARGFPLPRLSAFGSFGVRI